LEDFHLSLPYLKPHFLCLLFIWKYISILDILKFVIIHILCYVNLPSHSFFLIYTLCVLFFHVNVLLCVCHLCVYIILFSTLKSDMPVWKLMNTFHKNHFQSKIYWKGNDTARWGSFWIQIAPILWKNLRIRALHKN